MGENLPPSRDPVFDVLWTQTIEFWDDESRHASILEHAVRSQALAELAGQYRALIADERKGPVATKRLEAIVIAAAGVLEAMKTPRPAKVPLPILLSALGVSAFLLGWLALALWGRP
ncbi:MAG: hypothetical protein ABSC94_08485 [Polyangiaceae bacterium]|jgi:hypothetical protein